MKTILGFNGENIGELYILYHLLRSIENSKDWVILTKRPRLIKNFLDANKIKIKINSIFSLDFLKVRKILISGGGIFDKEIGGFWKLGLLLLLFLLKFKKIEIMWKDVSIYRDFPSFWLNILTRLFKKSNVIQLRDDTNKSILEFLRKKDIKYFVKKDLTCKQPIRKGFKKCKYILINFKSSKVKKKQFDTLISFLKTISKKYEICYIPFHYSDIKLCKKFGGPIFLTYHLKKFENLIKKSMLVISMRYHPLVFAKQFGVPSVGIYSHEKIKNFCKKYKIPMLINIDDNAKKLLKNFIDGYERKK